MFVMVTEEDVVISDISKIKDMEDMYHVEFKMYVSISSPPTVGVLSAAVLKQAIEVCQYSRHHSNSHSFNT